ncbi:hypothetical protein BVI434_980009 [Burkholderia vietnamiensis]|nr:hypothetical protein BVI434_980009 [Burkholderia vietnamiensis]
MVDYFFHSPSAAAGRPIGIITATIAATATAILTTSTITIPVNTALNGRTALIIGGSLIVVAMRNPALICSFVALSIRGDASDGLFHQFEDVMPRLAVKQLDHTVTSYAQDDKLLSDVAISPWVQLAELGIEEYIDIYKPSRSTFTYPGAIAPISLVGLDKRNLIQLAGDDSG